MEKATGNRKQDTVSNKEYASLAAFIHLSGIIVDSSLAENTSDQKVIKKITIIY